MTLSSLLIRPGVEHEVQIIRAELCLLVTKPRGRIIETVVKLQCSAPCISSYNMKATMCQQCCKLGSSKIYKFIVGRLYVSLRRPHCSQHMATNNM